MSTTIFLLFLLDLPCHRCYTAATLENSQPENDEGKACSLAAAIVELERFFRIEDFGRMEVVIYTYS